MQHWLHTRTYLYCEAGEGYLSQQLGYHVIYPLANPTVPGDFNVAWQKSRRGLDHKAPCCLSCVILLPMYTTGRMDSETVDEDIKERFHIVYSGEMCRSKRLLKVILETDFVFFLLQSKWI